MSQEESETQEQRQSIVDVWIVKHLYDLHSGKPETDVRLFGTEAEARAFVEETYSDFVSWDDEADEPVYVWCLTNGMGALDEYVELEREYLRHQDRFIEENDALRARLLKAESDMEDLRCELLEAHENASDDRDPDQMV